jgi:holin-like protein
MIGSAAIILAIAILADSLANQLAVPIPGAALGLIVLTAVFVLRGRPEAGVAALYDATSPHFPMFFVPAAVGLIASGDILVTAWLDILVAVALSTAATIAVTGWLAQTLLRTLRKTVPL